MRIGIFGSAADQQCQAVKALLEQRGAEVVLVESQGLNHGQAFWFDGEDYWAGGRRLSDVGSWYLRHVMSPLPPAFAIEDRYYLYADWYTEYMRRRERFGFQLSWLLWLGLRGVPAVNPPEHGSVVQMKPYQLAAAAAAGLAVPRTLITNSPQRVREFVAETGEVVYKPSMGGGLCHALDKSATARLDAIAAAPVTFQERVRGTSIRVTVIGQEVVSAVRIPTAELDYRASQEHAAGKQTYEPMDLPPELVQRCLRLMQLCGLVFSGIDFIQRADGSFVFLEANSSPIYLDVEQKTRTPITAKLADFLLRLASEPAGYRQYLTEVESRASSFIDYALPFDPTRGTGTQRGGR